MGENSEIEWTTHSFNAWIGCSRVSPACDNCYADAGSKRLAAQHRLKLWDDDSTRYMTKDAYWKQPAAWDRKAKAAGERHRVFCASYSDVAEDRPELVERRDRLIDTIESTPNLDWLLLTKRPENMVRLFARWKDWPRNVWAGTTVENQRWANTRIPFLLRIPSVIRFVSYEPALGPVDFTRIPFRGDTDYILDALVGKYGTGHTVTPFCFGLSPLQPIDWVIVGGESGPRARDYDIAWPASVIDQCRCARVPVFHKQLGCRPFEQAHTAQHDVYAKRIALTKDPRHGGDMSEWPKELRVREFPTVPA